MQPNLQRRIQRYGWDKAAGAYEAGWKDSLADAQDELLRIAGAKPGETVLDLACGTGLVTLPLADAVGATGRVIATDISDNMVEMVKEAAAAHGHAQVVAFQADAEALEALPDASVELVTCALGLMYFPDPAKAMRETLRVLKPGGRAVFAVWGERSKCGWAEIFPIVDARVRSSVCPLFFRLGTGPVLAQEMASSGFSDISETRLTSELCYGDEQAAADAAFIGGPVALAYHRFDEPTRAEARREYLGSITRFSSAGGYRIPGEFVVCCGFKERRPTS